MHQNKKHSASVSKSPAECSGESRYDFLAAEVELQTLDRFGADGRLEFRTFTF
jgi:hypothetical protein